MKRGPILAIVALGLLGGAIWFEGTSKGPHKAYEALARSEIQVNEAFELDEIEPRGSGPGVVGTIHASYRGPDEFDGLKIVVYSTETTAEESWERYAASVEDIRTDLSTRQPRFRNQICTLSDRTITCAVRLYEAVIEGTAGGAKSGFHEETARSNAQLLLMAGVKHWLDARGLGSPEEQAR